MASLLQYCLQKIKTVSEKTVKSPIQFSHKDLRLTNISNSWTSEHAILCKIEPKVTKVDPKNLKKRPFYVVIFFLRPDATGKPFYIDTIFNLDINFSNFEFYACLRRGVMGVFV